MFDNFSSYMHVVAVEYWCLLISADIWVLWPVPNYVGQSEVEASKDGRVLSDFYYGCAGYSLYSNKDHSTDKQVAKKELPVCVGLEVCSLTLFLCVCACAWFCLIISGLCLLTFMDVIVFK